MSAIYSVPPDVQMAARQVYYEGIRLSFAASAGFGLVAAVAAVFAKGRSLHRPQDS